jgi:hypothetical protein
MFLGQACYGLGATIAPFIATAFIQHVNRAYLYFTVTMGLGLITVTIIAMVLRFRTMDQLVGPPIATPEGVAVPAVLELSSLGEKETEIQGPTDESTLPQIAKAESHQPTEQAGASNTGDVFVSSPEIAPMSSGAKMLRIFKTPMVYPMLAYAFLYVSPSRT